MLRGSTSDMLAGLMPRSSLSWLCTFIKECVSHCDVSYNCYIYFKYKINNKSEMLGFCSPHFALYEFLTNYAVNLNMNSQVLGFFFYLYRSPSSNIFSWSPIDVIFSILVIF